RRTAPRFCCAPFSGLLEIQESRIAGSAFRGGFRPMPAAYPVSCRSVHPKQDADNKNLVPGRATADCVFALLIREGQHHERLAVDQKIPGLAILEAGSRHEYCLTLESNAAR